MKVEKVVAEKIRGYFEVKNKVLQQEGDAVDKKTEPKCQDREDEKHTIEDRKNEAEAEMVQIRTKVLKEQHDKLKRDEEEKAEEERELAKLREK
jgi:hypothetical protein